MSPYRVLVESSTTGKRFVLQSNSSGDRITGNRYICIVDRLVENPDRDGKYLSHTQRTRKNSRVVSRYRLCKKYDLPKGIILYSVVDSESLNTVAEEFTQQDCIVAAMNHFCKSNSLTIISQL